MNDDRVRKPEKTESLGRVFLPAERPAENAEVWEKWSSVKDEEGKPVYEPGVLYELERYFWIEGYRIPARIYNIVLNRYEQTGQKEFEVYRDILQDWGASIQDNERYHRKRWGRDHHIHSFKELAQHLLSIMPADQAQNIRGKMGKGMTAEQCIKLFPEGYQPCLRLRYSHDKKFEIDGKAEFRKAVKAVVTRQQEKHLEVYGGIEEVTF